MRSRIEIPRTAFPLAWPSGLPRSQNVRASDFHDMKSEPYETNEYVNGQWVKVVKHRKVRAKLSVASARDDVRAELQRLGAEEPVVISSNM
jgi:hypothetical protein